MRSFFLLLPICKLFSIFAALKNNPMKKLFTLALFALLGIAVKAQAPDVTIAVTNTTSTSVTANFTPNSSCTSYHILMAIASEMTMYTQMMQCPMTSLVISWGIEYHNADTYTWEDMVPGTEYTIYVAAIGNGDTVLCTQLATTQSQGGSGTSIINISVTDITASSARVICTPNEETSVFYDQLITKSYFEEIGQDSATTIVKESMYPMYATDDWTWSNLDENTEYYALAIGQNGSGEWGELAIMAFSTLESSIESNNLTTSQIYPNPTSDLLNIRTDAGDKQVEIINLLGQTIYNETVADENLTLNVSDWTNGVYIIRIKGNNGIAILKFIKR